MSYRIVSGIETHVQLSTSTKIFCGCSAAYGAPPNTNCCPICTGQPGALPMLNKNVVRFAIRAGLALHCKVAPLTRFARKNYFYPDLPKGYQISQYSLPLCSDGYIQLSGGRRIRIERLHLEEDAAKLIHENGRTYIDYNRSGIPLIEIVSKPDITSPQEAREYVEQLQLILRYAGVSDCKMQEGSMRCDVNISLAGENSAGTRTEIKNMNSPAYIERAMQYEAERQRKILADGGKVTQATLRFQESTGSTVLMRAKEQAEDYRYFNEPDIPAIIISPQFISSAGAPTELPAERVERHISMGVSPSNAHILVKYVNAGQFLDACVSAAASKANVGAEGAARYAKAAANLIVSTVFTLISGDEEREKFFAEFPSAEFAQLAYMVAEGKLNMEIARRVIEKLLTHGGKVADYVTEQNTATLSKEELERLCREAIAANPAAAADYRGGKLRAIGGFFGWIKRASGGRANISKAEEILKNLLKN